MQIKITGRLRPFSHTPGVTIPIPGTSCEVTAYPVKLIFRDLIMEQTGDLNLPIKGPVKGFTVFLDLDRGRIEVVGRARSGYFRYQITADDVSFHKGPRWDLPMKTTRQIRTSKEKLSLGISKKPDWDRVVARADLAEILPHWYALSQWLPPTSPPQKPYGVFRLLSQQIEPKDFYSHLETVFQVSFAGILSPRDLDEKYLGILPPDENFQKASSLGVIHASARLIRNLFIQENDELAFLPVLPKEFHAGRFTGITLSTGDEIDFEWSKKLLRRVIIRSKSIRPLQLSLQRSLKAFRLRTSLKQRGALHKASTPIQLDSGRTLYLDRFAK